MLKTLAVLFPLGLALLPAAGHDASAAEAPRVTTQTFSNWLYRCETAMADGKPGPTRCDLTQEVTVQQDGKLVPVMTLVFGQGADGKGHVVSLRLPLGVQLKPGVSVAADDGPAQDFAFYACGPRGCWVREAPADALLKSFKTGKTGRARVTFADGRPLAIEFQLAGLADGIAAIDAEAPDAAAAQSAQKPKPKAK